MILDSTITYLIMFSLTIFFSWLAQKPLNKINGKKGAIINYIFATIAILLPVVLAASRDITVGNDIRGYLLPNFSIAEQSSNLFQFLNQESPNVEPLFGILIYVGGVMKNIGVTFFLIELLTVAPVFITLFKLKDNVSVPLGMTVFLFLFYNFSLSGMRQSIAMSILLLAYYYYEYGNSKLRPAILALIAYGFHNSVIIICVLMLIIFELSKFKLSKIYPIFIIGLLFFFIIYDKLANLLEQIVGFISARYEYYISHYLSLYDGHVWSNIPIAELRYVVILTIIYFICIKMGRKSTSYTNNEKQFILFLSLGVFLVIFNANFYESLRLAFYFMYFLILAIASIKQYITDNFILRTFVYIVVMIPMIVYWGYTIMYSGAYVTNKFIFR